MNRTSLSCVTVVFGLVLLVALSGCGGDGDNNGGGGGGGGQAANPAFNGTFTGNLTSTQGGADFVTAVTMTLTVGSPLSGTFSTDEGDTGTISGNAEGNAATFTATIEGPCPGSLSGSMTLIDDNTLRLNGDGSDCDGSFSTTGELTRDAQGGGGGSATSQAITRTNQVIDRILELLFGDEAEVSRSATEVGGITRVAQLVQVAAETRQTEPVDITLLCSSGQVSFRGTVSVEEGETTDAFEIEGAFTFSNCEGISGTISFDSAGTVSSSQITIAMTLNGPLNAEGCTVTFTQFLIETTANLSGVITSPIVANGSLGATCDGDSVTCVLNDVDLADEEAFESSCQSV